MIKIENIQKWVGLVKAARTAGVDRIESVEQVVRDENLTSRERLALIMNVPSTH